MTDSEQVAEGTTTHKEVETEDHTKSQNGTHDTQEGGEGNAGPEQQDNEAQNNVDAPTPIGVIPDISNLTLKHPLQNRWVLWYDNPGKRTNAASWGDYLQKVTEFDTVEDFWRIFNNIKPASNLPAGSNYHLFKEGIEPKWEDVANSKGGKWVVGIPNSKNRKEIVDQVWLFAILAVIGESYEAAEEVCGIVVSMRKAQDRLALWTRDWKNEHVIKNLGRQLRASVELPENLTIGYLSHEDSLKTRSSKNRYEV